MASKLLYTLFLTLYMSVSVSQFYAQAVFCGSFSDYAFARDKYNNFYAWGYNYNGQFGDGSNRSKNSFIKLSKTFADMAFKSISTGACHSLAINSQGIIYSSGLNRYGQLGDGTTVDVNYFLDISYSGDLNGTKITSVSAGSNYSLALDISGRVFGWGHNYYGNIGDGTQSTRIMPVLIGGALRNKKITSIFSGIRNSFAIDEFGIVYSWGVNFGQFGSSSSSYKSPIEISSKTTLKGKQLKQIAPGGHHILFLDTNGKVYSCGNNYFGQIGDGTNDTRKYIKGIGSYGALRGKHIIAIASGEDHCLALDNHGRVYSWGKNYNGQLGNGTTTHKYYPELISGRGILYGKKIIAIKCGKQYSLALDENGFIYVWGQNNYGQVKAGITSYSITSPILITNTVLPVELSAFEYSVTDNSVTLNWTTESENNNYGFEIEKYDTSLGNWERIAFTEGHGNSNTRNEYSFVIENPSQGKSTYRLKQIDLDGKYEYSKELEINFTPIMGFDMQQNYPNPFNPTTTISYQLPKEEKVTLKVYDVLGKEVSTLVDDIKQCGKHKAKFNASNLASGVYIYTIRANDYVSSKKMLLIK